MCLGFYLIAIESVFGAEDVLHGSAGLIVLLFYCILKSLPSFHLNPIQIPNTKLESRRLEGKGQRLL